MNKKEMKLIVCALLTVPVFLTVAGCSLSWSLSDEEAVKLVQDHYLFSFEGEKVLAEVVERGTYIEDCECFPIRFRIVDSNSRERSKTLYFYKDDTGNPAVSGFMKIVS